MVVIIPELQLRSDAAPTSARIQTAGDSAILFDAGLAVQPEDNWFESGHWRAQGKLRDQACAGRGAVVFVETPAGMCALRHYHRGGMIATALGDRYLWTGRERTRGFVEFRLLAELRRRRLPVPTPVAARYRSQGIYYTADLMTCRIEHTRSLAECLRARDLDARMAARVGALVAGFHAQGIDHADLNAHNVLVGPNGLWLLDFDRGRIRAKGKWCLGNLRRLRRSLLKLGACDHDEARFDSEIWQPLLRAYEAAA